MSYNVFSHVWSDYFFLLVRGRVSSNVFVCVRKFFLFDERGCLMMCLRVVGLFLLID